MPHAACLRGARARTTLQVTAALLALLAGCRTAPDPERERAEQRAAAREQHAQALAAAEPEAALAHEERAYALLATSCPTCAREQIPILLHMARLHAQRGDAAGLVRCAERLARLGDPGLDPRKLSDWPSLRRLAALHEQLGDFASAARIERGILDAKLEILDPSHPQVAASRERIAELERRAASAAAPAPGSAP